MKSDNTHVDLLVALARCVHQLHVGAERHKSLGRLEIFDNMCAGPLELVAETLDAAGFTKFIDDLPRSSIFVCMPDDFDSVARTQRAKDVDRSKIERALFRLSDENFASAEEVDRMVGQSHRRR